jgi:hypothetical protein
VWLQYDIEKTIFFLTRQHATYIHMGKDTLQVQIQATKRERIQAEETAAAHRRRGATDLRRR